MSRTTGMRRLAFPGSLLRMAHALSRSLPIRLREAIARARSGALVVVLLAGALLSTQALARPCTTMALREAYRRGSLPLSSLALQTRPASVGFLDSTTLPVRVHYETEGVGARAAEVLALVEDAWTTLVDDMGFPAPLPDEGEGGDERLDVYVGFVPVGAFTYAHDDVSDSDGRAATYAYIHLSASLDEALMPTFVHHEMAHVVQFALDSKESLMFAEASAVAYERLALPDVAAWADSLEDFQSYPQAPLFTNGIDWRGISGDDTLYEFGAALFLLYLEQEHGSFDGTLVRRLWEASAQPDVSSDAGVDDNEPDWLDALPDVTGAAVSDLVLDFASWRVLLGGWAVPDDGLLGGGSLPGTALVSALRVRPEDLDGAPVELARSRSPHQLGCATLEMQALGVDVPLYAAVTSLPDDDGAVRPLGVAWVLGNPDEDRAERGRLDDTGAELEASLVIPAGDTLLLSLCDVGDADADDLPATTEIALTLHNENLPLYDAGVPDDDAGPAHDAGAPDDDAGFVCGCQQVPSRSQRNSNKQGPFSAIRPYALAAMSVLGLLILIGRGRRVVSRKRLYKQDAARRRE